MGNGSTDAKVVYRKEPIKRNKNRYFSGDFGTMCTLIRIMIRLLCWTTRTFQAFRGRWRLMKWLKKQDNLMGQIGPTSIKTALGFKMVVNPYEFVGRHIFVEGVYEPDCTGLFATLLRPGDCVVDVGANIGYFSLLASKLVGPSGQVHSFEPSPEALEWLGRNIKLNLVINVVVHAEAASDFCGPTHFYQASFSNLGLSSFRDIGDLCRDKLIVRSITLDSMMIAMPKVKLVKIDVEGAEFMVLRGMNELIKRDKPFIILELTKDFLVEMGCSDDLVFKCLRDLNYSLYEITGNDLKQIVEPQPYQCHILSVHETMVLPT